MQQCNLHSTKWESFLTSVQETQNWQISTMWGRKGLSADSASLRAAHPVLWNPVWECFLVTRSRRQDPAKVWEVEWSVHELGAQVPGCVDTVYVCSYLAKLPTHLLKLRFRLLLAKETRRSDRKILVTGLPLRSLVCTDFFSTPVMGRQKEGGEARTGQQWLGPNPHLPEHHKAMKNIISFEEQLRNVYYILFTQSLCWGKTCAKGLCLNRPMSFLTL